MARPDSGAVDRALLAVLQADAVLAGLMPGGVWFGLAAPGLTRFVLVGIEDAVDEDVYGQVRAFESSRYLVQAVGLSRECELGDAKAAAHRIDELLSDAPLATPADYGSIDCAREERFGPLTVADELDKSIAWFHAGGYYRVNAYWPDPVSVEE